MPANRRTTPRRGLTPNTPTDDCYHQSVKSTLSSVRGGQLAEVCAQNRLAQTAGQRAGKQSHLVQTLGQRTSALQENRLGLARLPPPWSWLWRPRQPDFDSCQRLAASPKQVFVLNRTTQAEEAKRRQRS